MHREELRILVVDDDPEDFEITHALLRKCKHLQVEAVWEPSYEQAKQKLLNRSFHICLMDYQLGAETGLDLLRAVRLLGSGVPVIILTGQGSEEVDGLALEAGAADYLQKDRLETSALERSIRYAVMQTRMLETIAMNSRLWSLGELAACITHEINAPLHHIYSFADLAKVQLTQTPIKVEALGACITAIREASVRMDKIIRSVLNLSRGDNGEAPQATRLQPVLEGVVSLCRPRLQEMEIDLSIAAFAPDLTISCRENEIAQVFLNLVKNAIDAIATLEIRWIKIDVLDFVDSVEISVTDSGTDLPQHIREQMLTSFFSTKKRGQGTGLGLLISKRIVMNHGGSLELDGASKHTRLLLKLPLCNDRAEVA